MDLVYQTGQGSHEMSELQKIVDELQIQYDTQCELKRDLARKLDEAKKALHNSTPIQEEDRILYETKLQDMRKYIAVRMKKSENDSFNWNWIGVSWMIRKQATPYRNDFGSIVSDPLDIAVAEYALLAMGSHFDIRFDVHQDAVQRFLFQWMEENMAGSAYEQHLFAFN